MAWHPECVRVDSPNFGYPRGQHGQLRSNIQAVAGGGAFFHSVVGSSDAARNRFLNPAEEASAHFIIRKADVPIQMVDSADAAWHAGGELHDDPVPGGPGLGSMANVFFHGFEFEGGPPGNYSEPLTENQKLWAIKLVHWLESIREWQRVGFYFLRETLWEHNWVYPTACPSGRIPWEEMINRLMEDDMWTDEEKNVALARLQNIDGLDDQIKAVADGIAQVVQRLDAESKQKQRILVKQRTRDHVYELTEQQTLVHIPFPEAYDVSPEDINVLPNTSPVFRLQVTYPGGVPF